MNTDYQVIFVSFETVNTSWHEQAASLIACNLRTVEDFENRMFFIHYVSMLGRKPRENPGILGHQV